MYGQIRYSITIQFKDVPTLIRRGYSLKIWIFKSYKIIKTGEKRYRIARAKARELRARTRRVEV